MILTNSDGGARGNPGEAAIGILIRDENQILKKYSAKIGTATNNIAEYNALIKALELALEYTKEEVICFLDSELIVKQLLGEYRVKNPVLLELFLKVQKLQENFKAIKYKHVSRQDKFQKIVDNLLNRELDKK
ncbi:MAG: ribonuclease HI family protein [Candidatus Pacearchaeota archaeon]|nr:ribonuclease HI family protein [Candidatus Pacearchaeota archaeon]